LTDQQFNLLADVPPTMTWYSNIDNPQTRRAYQRDLQEFMVFTGIDRPAQFRVVTRAHILAWRRDLEERELAGPTIRRKLAALSSLFDYLCEANAVKGNPVKGVKRPKTESQEGKTPAIGDHQARSLLNAPDATTLRGRRDRAILSILLYHGLRRAELCALTVGDLHQRRGVTHLRIHGKGGKLRYVPLHPGPPKRLMPTLRWLVMLVTPRGRYFGPPATTPARAAPRSRPTACTRCWPATLRR